MLKCKGCFEVFEKSINTYHILDDVEQPFRNPYESGTIENTLYRKNWIDTIQWHREDIIRKPDIDLALALQIKRNIDRDNQERVDLVEHIEDVIAEELKNVNVLPDATINTETPGWAIDRLSILALKIYHMQIEANRSDAGEDHIRKCQRKLNVLVEQKADMFTSIDQLLDDLAAGKKKMKLYKQMKMYNDPELNPVLYKK
jgi:uncharacterized protein DUF4254